VPARLWLTFLHATAACVLCCVLCCVQRLGIDTENLIVCQPDYGELAFNVMDECVRSGSVSLIVVDSVSALVPRSEIEGDIGTPQVGVAVWLVTRSSLGYDDSTIRFSIWPWACP
jgi:hypothetical protein